MAAGSLDFLHLYLSTRRRVHADSSDAVQVFVGSQEIRFPTPTEPQGSEPPPLDSTWSILQPVTVPFDPQDPVSLELGIAGGDAWAPREALLLGGWRREGGPRFDPVAVGILRPRHEDSATATIWLSQDPSEGPARVALSRFLPVSADEPLHEFVLQLSTDRSYAQTEGSIDLKMYTLRDGIPLLVYQTQLPRTGNQEPGATGPYLHRFRLPSPGIPSSAIHTVTLTNRSDDARGVSSTLICSAGRSTRRETYAAGSSTRTTGRW